MWLWERGNVPGKGNGKYKGPEQEELDMQWTECLYPPPKFVC